MGHRILETCWTTIDTEGGSNVKKTIGILLTITLALVGLGINPCFASDYPKVIRFGQPGGSYGIPLSTGAIGRIQAQNLFEEEFKNEGIKIEYYYIRSAGPGVQEALANNALDLGSSGDLPSIAGRAGGLKTRAIAASRGGNTYVVVPIDSNIKSIKEIKGKKVGVNLGTYMHAALLKILADNGLSPKDLKLVNMDSSTLEIAVRNKDVEVAFIGSNALTLRNQNVARILYDTREEAPWYQNAGALLVRDEFAKKYPDIVRRFVKIYVKALYQHSLDKSESQKFDTRAGSPLATLKENDKGRSILYTTTPKFDEQWVTHDKRSIALFKEHNLIRKTFDPETEWIDRSFLDAALKELKLEDYWPDYDANGNPGKK